MVAAWWKTMGDGANRGRRKAVKAMAAGAACLPLLPVLRGFARGHAGHNHTGQAPGVEQKPAADFQPAFFNAHEFAIVSAVCERITPSDETPGAREARVSEFVDLMVSHTPKLHDVYRKGLAWLDQEAQKRHQLPFVKLPAAQQDAVLRLLAEVEEPSPPHKVAVQFFRSVRKLTIDGFYTSKIGLRELGYVGNSYFLEYKGCTHSEHG